MESNMACRRCRMSIDASELHKIVICVVRERFTEHRYEHVECPGKFVV